MSPDLDSGPYGHTSFRTGTTFPSNIRRATVTHLSALFAVKNLKIYLVSKVLQFCLKKISTFRLTSGIFAEPLHLTQLLINHEIEVFTKPLDEGMLLAPKKGYLLLHSS